MCASFLSWLTRQNNSIAFWDLQCWRKNDFLCHGATPPQHRWLQHLFHMGEGHGVNRSTSFRPPSSRCWTWMCLRMFGRLLPMCGATLFTAVYSFDLGTKTSSSRARYFAGEILCSECSTVVIVGQQFQSVWAPAQRTWDLLPCPVGSSRPGWQPWPPAEKSR